MSLIAFALLAYLIGSVSFAVVVSRAMGLPDPRTYGSKNPGATNVMRTGRKLAAVVTLAGDGAKGWLAVFLTQLGTEPSAQAPGMAIAAVAVVLGHLYPVFHRFAGGKGVATALGVLVALNGWLALGTAATWLVIALFFRISSLAALCAAAFAPAFCWMLYGRHVFTASVAVVAALLVWRHRGNIRNLIAGTEGRIGQKKTGA